MDELKNDSNLRKRPRMVEVEQEGNVDHIPIVVIDNNNNLLTPKTLWNTVDSAVWRRYLPPPPLLSPQHRSALTSSSLFIEALARRRAAMKRPSNDILFDANDSVPSASFLYFDERDYLVNTALSGGDAAVECKAAVVRLMEWKLQRGVFRPGLLQQVKGNEPDDVLAAVQGAMQALREDAKSLSAATMAANAAVGGGGATPSSSSSSSGSATNTEDIIVLQMLLCRWMKANHKLCRLRGVGPATASLLLSRFRLSDDAMLPLLSSSAASGDGNGTHAVVSRGVTQLLRTQREGMFPFFGDEAAAVALGHASKSSLLYTVGELGEFAMRMWKRYVAIVNEEDVDTSDSLCMTPASMTHALWAAEVLSSSAGKK